MKKLYGIFLGIIFLIAAMLLIVGTIALLPMGIALQIVSSFISVIMIVASLVCFTESLTKQAKKYDPYDISDID